MHEYHLWIVLRYDDYDSVDTEQEQFIEKFKNYLRVSQRMTDEDLSKYLLINNASFCFQYFDSPNHESNLCMEIMEWVASSGKGSYGMMHYLDHEDINAAGRIHILKRGKILSEKDDYLSPVAPELEEPYDSKNPPMD